MTKFVFGIVNFSHECFSHAVIQDDRISLNFRNVPVHKLFQLTIQGKRTLGAQEPSTISQNNSQNVLKNGKETYQS